MSSVRSDKSTSEHEHGCEYGPSSRSLSKRCSRNVSHFVFSGLVFVVTATVQFAETRLTRSNLPGNIYAKQNGFTLAESLTLLVGFRGLSASLDRTRLRASLLFRAGTRGKTYGEEHHGARQGDALTARKYVACTGMAWRVIEPFAGRRRWREEKSGTKVSVTYIVAS